MPEKYHGWYRVMDAGAARRALGLQTHLLSGKKVSEACEGELVPRAQIPLGDAPYVAATWCSLGSRCHSSRGRAKAASS